MYKKNISRSLTKSIWKVQVYAFHLIFVRYIFVLTPIDLHTLNYWNLFLLYKKYTFKYFLGNNCCITLTLKSCSSVNFWVSRNGASVRYRLISGFKLKGYQAMFKLYKNFDQFHLKKNCKTQHFHFLILNPTGTQN